MSTPPKPGYFFETPDPEWQVCHNCANMSPFCGPRALGVNGGALTLFDGECRVRPRPERVEGEPLDPVELSRELKGHPIRNAQPCSRFRRKVAGDES